MEKQKYIEDIEEIKQMMHRSSRFISLSGLSGILAGICSLIALYLANMTVYSKLDYMANRSADLSDDQILQLLGIAVSAIILSFISGFYLTNRKARKLGQSIFDDHALRLVYNLTIPLLTGGILCLILLFKGYLALLAPLTLIFYGLALVHASRYAVTSMRNLGITEIILGLLAFQFLEYGLIFWAIGFGLMHIIYGIVMYINDKS